MCPAKLSKSRGIVLTPSRDDSLPGKPRPLGGPFHTLPRELPIDRPDQFAFLSSQRTTPESFPSARMASPRFSTRSTRIPAGRAKSPPEGMTA
jgi:hypothetical protein